MAGQVADLNVTLNGLDVTSAFKPDPSKILKSAEPLLGRPRYADRLIVNLKEAT